MSKFDKLLLKLLSGNADNNFSFDDFRNVLFHFNFIERTTGGSHPIFYKDGVEEIINIQPNESKTISGETSAFLNLKIQIDNRWKINMR